MKVLDRQSQTIMGGGYPERGAVGMRERWKPWKAKGRLSTRSHRSLEISPTPRDFHIPTAGAGRGWKKWKTKTRFPTFSTRGPRLQLRVAPPSKTKNRRSGPAAGRGVQSKETTNIAVSGTAERMPAVPAGFRIIIRLENAPARAAVR